MLYANANVEDTSGQYTKGYESDLMYRSLFVWNASQLVQAALDAQKSGRKLIIPIDRNGSGASSIQYPADTPARYDVTRDGMLFGWIYGVGSYSSQQGVQALSLQNLPELQKLAPSVFKAAQSAAIAAKIPADMDLVDKSNGTLETFAVRTMAQLISLGSTIAASAQSVFGKDNSEMLAQAEDAQRILKYTGYNTAQSGLAGHVASIAQSVDGLVGGFAMIDTNIAGAVFHGAAVTEEFVTGNKVDLPSPTDFLKMVNSDASFGDKINYTLMAALKYNPVTLAAEGLYRMGSAALREDWVELRNASYDMGMLGLSMKWDQSPASKRELQLKVKQVDFLKQQLRTGVIEKTPLSDLVYEAPNVKEYVIEKGRRDASGQVVSDARVYAADTVAPACDGILDFNEKGEVVYKTCFAPGTLVHTDHGLVPVEKIRVGTRVLSQPEQGGEQDYRSVINTVAHLDQPIYAVQVEVDGADELSTLFATGNHPFWVEDVLVEGEHWLAAECLAPGHVLQMADGRKASVHASALIRRTQHLQIGFAADDRAGVGIVLDLSERQIKLADSALTRNLGQLELGEAYLSPVYNFEVEEFHTYYVGEAAVWVHNTNCTPEYSQERVFDRADVIERLEEGSQTCFAAGTLVHTREGLKPIEEIRVGDWVLSYPDDQKRPRRIRAADEYMYKRVTHTFVTEDQSLSKLIVSNLATGGRETLLVTANHPVYNADRGWVPLVEMDAGDVLENFIFGNLLVYRVYHDVGRGCVYNFEVDDFHSYYVGEQGVWVHNKCEVQVTKVRDLEGLTEKKEIYRKGDYLNLAEKDSTANTARIGEDAGDIALYKSTGRDFRTDMRNKSDNGPDYWCLDDSSLSSGGRATLTVADAKGSLRGRYPGVENLKLNQKTLSWMYEGSGEAFKPGGDSSPFKGYKQSGKGGAYEDGQGRINDQVLDESVQKEFRRAYDLWKAGKLDITTLILEVKVPKAGESGPLTVTIAPNPGKFERTVAEGAASGICLTDHDISALLPAARQYWIDAGVPAARLAGIDIGIADLAPGISGMTVGNEITLSADGAGWGWFVDATPAQQEEFGTGDAADEFKATAGSAAAGKMDLLTVLVHELGHELGLGHVTGDDDLMAQYLDPEGQVLFSIILSCSNARSSVSSCAAPRFWRKAKPAKALGALGGLCV